MTTLYVGDTGTAIVLDAGQDISDATAVSIEVRKPDGRRVSWPATVLGTTGVRHVTGADTLDASGVWRLQARVVTPGGAWRGQTVSISVAAQFE